MKKFAFSFSLICALLLSIILVGETKTVKSTTAIADYKSMVVIEQNTKRVLNEYNKDLQLPMASTTKIMTALVVLKNCNNLEEEVLIDDRAIGIEGTSMYLRKGEKLTVKELLCGMLLPSGNDASCALAYHFAPTMEEFAKMMNQEAESLGLKNTSFKNSHGLDEQNHFTSAYDLAVISAEAMKFDEFIEIVSSPFIQVKGAGGEQGETRYLKNKNKLLHCFEGTTGIKTGFTDNAGRCFVSSATKGNLKLICVVLNCPNMFEVSQNLLAKAFENYNYVELLPAYNCYRKIQVSDGKKNEVKLYTKQGFSYPLTQEEINFVAYEYNIPETLQAPIQKEQVVGKVEIKLDNQVLFEENIYAVDEVKSINVINNFKEILDQWFNR